MKKILFLLISVFMVFGLVACGDENENEISFSWWGTSDRNKATYEAIELFEQKYPQYTVKADQSAWSGYDSTLWNRLKQGRESDVFQINYNWIYQMYGIDYFMDIKALDFDLSQYPEEEHNPLTVDGKILALSVSETGYIFYLNKKVYDDAGITELPTTWAELIAAGQTISQRSPGKYAIGRLDSQQVAILIFTYLAQLTGKNVISAENKLNFSQEELESGFAFINTLRNSGVLIPSNAQDTYNDGPTNPKWVNQSYGGVVTWNTAISEYQNTLPASAELVTAGMMQQEEGQQLGMYKKVSMAYAVSKRVEESKAKKEAVRTFLEFMTTDPEALKILGVDRGITGHAASQQILRESTDPVFTSTLEWQGHEIVQ
ncbi:MAG: carbohydrate ABC transporter substrate-binding protein, partial [Acholeplasmataceae bacterium]|nr:carbohydrate ABC transporter substrate-binding protein [Acholeplasmataceae bacterium]